MSSLEKRLDKLIPQIKADGVREQKYVDMARLAMKKELEDFIKNEIIRHLEMVKMREDELEKMYKSLSSQGQKMMVDACNQYIADKIEEIKKELSC